MSGEWYEVTDPQEQEAVREGKIEGEVYTDGEVWADSMSLTRWRIAQAEKAL